MIAMIMNLLSGTKVIKNARSRKRKLRKNFFLLLGIHQDDGIGVCQKTKKKRQKNCLKNLLICCDLKCINKYLNLVKKRLQPKTFPSKDK